jgi:hypothetical protein
MVMKAVSNTHPFYQKEPHLEVESVWRKLWTWRTALFKYLCAFCEESRQCRGEVVQTLLARLVTIFSFFYSCPFTKCLSDLCPFPLNLSFAQQEKVTMSHKLL